MNGDFFPILSLPSGRDISVGTTIRYGVGGVRIESRWGRYFPHPSTPAQEPTLPAVQWVAGVILGRGVNHRLPFSVGVKERVELFLYSSFWPPWPVIRRTFIVGQIRTC